MFKDYRNILGLILIVGGVLLGLQQFGIVSGGALDALFTAAFALTAIMFATIYFGNRSQWWAALVALILIGLALTSAISLFFPALEDGVGGPIFLFMIGVGFLFVYLTNRMMWWAIIPSGVLLSLSLVAFLDNSPRDLGFDPAGVLFLGMGITFLIVSRVSYNGQRMSWGVFPAIPLLIMGLFIGLGSSSLWSFAWPIILIVLGLYFVLTTLRKS